MDTSNNQGLVSRLSFEDSLFKAAYITIQKNNM